ncbi:hypothetical protein [Yoonia sp. SDW83-1]|uniref:hypothetical protein n=1 Tax=Yoonia sp. SDW83-1 TaxID=3366945 RepID=UPI00398C284E
MQYQIPPNVLPGARPRQVVHPYAILFVMMMCGAGIGCALAAYNARQLGCLDQRRQWTVLTLFWLAVVVVAIIARWFQMSFEPDHIGNLFGDVLKSLTLVGAFVAACYAVDRQSVLYSLHTQEKSGLLRSIGFALGAIGIAFVISLLLAEVPHIRLMFVGGSAWTR